jgi:hypothetical protein
VEESKLEDTLPPSVCDAARQTIGLTDKRTTIEVLVTQDKLACSGSTTKWVSSEQQYADGLTKQSAAQLLADRLRFHLVKLKSDMSFQAAKKKSPQERKRTAEMFAVKRPPEER